MQVNGQYLRDGIPFFILLELFGIILLDCAQQKCRIVSRMGKACGARSFVPTRGVDLSVWLFLFTWEMNNSLVDFTSSHSNRVHTHLSTMEFMASIALYFILFFYVALSVFFQLSLRKLIDYRVSRGKLFASVSRFAKGSKFLSWDGVPLYVIRDSDYAKVCPRSGKGVILPLGLLNQLTRCEIDTLAARQLCLQSIKFYSQALVFLLASDIAVVTVVQWMRVATLFPSSYAYRCWWRNSLLWTALFPTCSCRPISAPFS